MNYFELFNIPLSLSVKRDLIRNRFLELSRKYHPDFFASAGNEEQANALEMSAQLNKAYKTLSNRDETIRYVLTIKGLLQEEEKFKLGNDFLMQMLEVNEEIAASVLDPSPTVKEMLEKQLKDLEEEQYAPVRNIIENYQDGITTTEQLLMVKEYYFRKKYLQRLYDQLDGIS